MGKVLSIIDVHMRLTGMQTLECVCVCVCVWTYREVIVDNDPVKVVAVLRLYQSAFPQQVLQLWLLAGGEKE